MLDFRAGGWVLLVAGLFAVAFLGWRFVPSLGRDGPEPMGDGEQVASYGFDLSDSLVPAEVVVAAGVPKDGIPALTDPAAMRVEDADILGGEAWTKYLVPGDRVVGVAVEGEARAYPLRVLNWHEVANDVLGGRPIAVTYSPLCDSVVVFDRRVDGEVLEFGVSGLLFNSNLLMYDRRHGGGESLWSQLQRRAVAGPAARAGRRLSALPCSVVTWRQWRERYPDTTVIRPEPGFARRYRRDPYGSYFSNGRLRFPVRPLPPEDGPGLMSRVVVARTENGQWIFPLDAGEGIRTLDVDGRATLTLDGLARPPTVSVEAGEGEQLEIIHAFWFAWYATHPR